MVTCALTFDLYYKNVKSFYLAISKYNFSLFFELINILYTPFIVSLWLFSQRVNCLMLQVAEKCW
jgi:hypothetical protein